MTAHKPEEGHATAHHGPIEELRPGWSRPRPEHVPRPTYWPAVTAFGIALIGWGLVMSLIVSGMGVVLVIAGIVGWIWEFKYGEE